MKIVPHDFIKTLAIIAKDVYFDPFDNPKHPDWVPLPTGWTRFFTYNEGGCVCATYLYDADNPNGPSQMVFAYRGTVITSPTHLFADYGIMEGKVNLALRQLILHVGKFRQMSDSYFEQQYGNASTIAVTHTGHSLGAILAQLTSYPYPAITFENPGAGNLLLDYFTRFEEGTPQEKEAMIQHSTLNHTTILADLNVINTCQPQAAAEIYKVLHPSYDYSTINILDNIYPPPSWLSNYHYTLEYSFNQQHSMKGIRDYLLGNGALQITQYPSTPAAGYKAYLNPDRKAYWLGYAKAMWDSHPTEHAIFHDFDSFYIDFENKLTQIWKEASIQSVASKTSVKEFTLFRKPKISVMIETYMAPEL